MDLDERHSSPLNQDNILTGNALDGGKSTSWYIGGDAIVGFTIRAYDDAIHDVGSEVDECESDNGSSRAGTREW